MPMSLIVGSSIDGGGMRMCHEPEVSLPALPVTRLRITLRLAEPARLPPFKGALLRGGLGYALQRIGCPQMCWDQGATCPAALPTCAYRELFEPALPAGRETLHDLRDAPRPFVIEPPLDQRRNYAAGDPLEFGMLLFGRGIDFLPYVVLALAEFARAGLGRYQHGARLERVEALAPGQPFGVTIFYDGESRFVADLPTLNLAELSLRAARLPANLRLALRTPLRVKARGELMMRLDVPALIQAIGWRIFALTHFYGEVPWLADYQPAVALARQITIDRDTTRWVDWERSSTRPNHRQSMTLGGLIGAATLRNVPRAVRALLLAASVVHAGKACVFGHGQLDVYPAS